MQGRRKHTCLKRLPALTTALALQFAPTSRGWRPGRAAWLWGLDLSTPGSQVVVAAILEGATHLLAGRQLGQQPLTLLMALCARCARRFAYFLS